MRLALMLFVDGAMTPNGNFLINRYSIWIFRCTIGHADQAQLKEIIWLERTAIKAHCTFLSLFAPITNIFVLRVVPAVAPVSPIESPQFNWWKCPKGRSGGILHIKAVKMSAAAARGTKLAAVRKRSRNIGGDAPMGYCGASCPRSGLTAALSSHHSRARRRRHRRM